ncbi:MAG: sigma 54-interacting transcriptional regulator [Pirellulaceae bacterium]|jgi:Nif-specific regulatory protein|nr:sigma-54-dependent Fis family transcriptional regulator [Planctomycetaceae bacterium]MDP6468522.1 sigma 54-interacting transcriptional regulator [Pirellulaceae bacterium]
MLAYLVIREGTKWTDVFRLTPGRTVTIGRASTCQIVIKDERCSRNHGEVFSSEGDWIIRDLDSRNGTVVSGEPIQGDHTLIPGEVIRIAHCQMAFVHDLSQAFVGVDEPPDPGGETVNGLPMSSISDSHVLDDSFEPTTIMHRRGHTRFLQRNLAADSSPPKVGESAAQLCRLAFELANQTSVSSAANLALDGLFEGTIVDGGGLWLASRDARDELTIDEMELIASRTDIGSSYRRVSAFLATMVLKDGEAVLARNIEGDSSLGIRDSAGVFSATSVICAPIRQESKVIGLVHLYCTDGDRTLDADDLEFTLAVAENVALALKNLGLQQSLTEDLSATRSEVVQLRKQLGEQSEIIGSSAIMKQVQEDISRAAPSRATVLIRGESGVGKELVARAVHYSSPRSNGPFVCLNCAALSETLLESELFGHERGAFTGATERKIGKFEQADQGTVMLDEIGEMSSSIQSKFLRVLEGHPFERVGGSKAIKVDVRVIAATNRNLERAVADGSFRRDLYFRLHVVEIQVPPLRKHPSDIIELANFFLDRFNEDTGRKLAGYSPEAVNLMQHYRWPGNVRELRNVIERAVLLTHHEVIAAEDLTLSNLATASESGEFQFSSTSYDPSTLADVEKRHIAATLSSTGWNKSRAAEILGIERSTLDRKIKRYELKANA